MARVDFINIKEHLVQRPIDRLNFFVIQYNKDGSSKVLKSAGLSKPFDVANNLGIYDANNRPFAMVKTAMIGGEYDGKTTHRISLNDYVQSLYNYYSGANFLNDNTYLGTRLIHINHNLQYDSSFPIVDNIDYTSSPIEGIYADNIESWYLSNLPLFGINNRADYTYTTNIFISPINTSTSDIVLCLQFLNTITVSKQIIVEFVSYLDYTIFNEYKECKKYFDEIIDNYEEVRFIVSASNQATKGYNLDECDNVYFIQETKPAREDTFSVTLYNCSCEDNRVDKSPYMNELYTFTGILRDECSIMEPVINFQILDRNILNANYAYINQFDRYYYIDDIVSIRKNVWEVYMRVDPLMSFKRDILNLDCYVLRQEFNYNDFIPDEKRPAEMYSNIEYVSASIGDLTEYDIATYGGYKNIDYESDPSKEPFFYSLIIASNAGVEDSKGGLGVVDLSYIDPNVMKKCLILPTSRVKELTEYMWSATFIENIELLWKDKGQPFISLIYYPFNIKVLSEKNKCNTITLKSCNLGNVSYTFKESTSEFPKVITSIGFNYFGDIYRKPEYIRFSLNMGEMVYELKYNSYLDSPQYTSIFMYIPWYGYESIDFQKAFNIDHITDLSENKKGIRFKLDLLIDIESTNHIAVVSVYSNSRRDFEEIQYINVSIGTQIPLSQSNKDEQARGILMAGMKTALAVVTQGASLAVASPAQDLTETTFNYQRLSNRKNSALKLSSIQESTTHIPATYKATWDSEKAKIKLPQTISNLTVDLMQNAISKYSGGSGFNSQNATLQLENRPKLLIMRPSPLFPDGYDHMVGRPSSFYGKLSELNGYTEVGATHIENLGRAIPAERNQIENALKSGVLLPDKT